MSNAIIPQPHVGVRTITGHLGGSTGRGDKDVSNITEIMLHASGGRTLSNLAHVDP